LDTHGAAIEIGRFRRLYGSAGASIEFFNVLISGVIAAVVIVIVVFCL